MKYNIVLSLFSLACLLVACTEKYELSAEDYESLLVVEATLTDELGLQEIHLSRTIPLNASEPIYVNNAQVRVEDGNLNSYLFTNSGMGNYVSNEAFQTIEGQSYTLYITVDEKNYISNSEIAPPTSQIQDVSAHLLTVNGEEGIQVLVSNNPGDAVYFKYDYEETYKIVPPFYNGLDFTIENVGTTDGESTYDIVLQPKEEDVSACYSTNYSTAIIQASLNDLEVNSIQDFPIRFIEGNNGVIRDRYSILVKQYVQSFEAYNFYRLLKELGITENLLIENQPGFIQGNITAVENASESVFGFFQVSSVTSARVFFNYADFNILRPPYVSECEFQVDVDYNDNTGIDGDRNDRAFMLNIFSQDSPSWLYFEGTFPIFTFVSASCGDCTRLSSTVIPEFWED